MPPFHGGVKSSVVHSVCVQLATGKSRSTAIRISFACFRRGKCRPLFIFVFVDACVGPRSLKCYVFLAVMGATLESRCCDSFL